MTRIHYQHPDAVRRCTQSLLQSLQMISNQHPLICVCIGTDRSTGDSLGPMVGTLLSKHPHPHRKVFGTLANPVHAINLPQTLQQIQQQAPQSPMIAIDACLGKSRNVGMIQVGEGPIKPGAGVNKQLPEVGHFHITGIVNVAGFMEYVVLQNTRLHMVMTMAELISQSLDRAIQQFIHQKTIV